MSKKPVLRRVCIVFEETGGSGFQVKLEGVSEDRKRLPDDQLSPAEYWGGKMFQIVGSYLQRAGAVESVSLKTEPGKN